MGHCPDCGAERSQTSKFCDECGHKFSNSTMAAESTSKSLDEEKDTRNDEVLINGPLKKKATLSRHMWQPRYFVLHPDRIAYYKNEKDANDKKGASSLLCCDIEKAVRAESGKGSEDGCRLNLQMKENHHRKMIELMSETPEACVIWCALINKRIKNAPESIRILYDGQLKKKSPKLWHVWQPRYFVILPEIIMYYESEKEKVLHSNSRSFPCSAIIKVEKCGSEKGFEDGCRFNIHTEKRVFELLAPNKEECNVWITKFQSVQLLTGEDDFLKRIKSRNFKPPEDDIPKEKKTRPKSKSLTSSTLKQTVSSGYQSFTTGVPVSTPKTFNFKIVCEGPLKFRTENRKWNKFYFLLLNDSFKQFESQKDRQINSVFRTIFCKDITVLQTAKAKHRFELSTENQPIKGGTENRIYEMMADSQSDFDQWFKAFTNVLGKDRII